MSGRPSCRCGGAGCGRCGDVLAQAEDWVLARCPEAVAGQHGHDAAFRAACTVVKGFDLQGEAALRALEAWNALCLPPWSARELAYKVSQAEKAADDKARGYLRWEGRGGGAVERMDPADAWEAARAAEVARSERAAENGRKAHVAPALDRAALAEKAAEAGVRVDAAFLRARSPVDPAGVGSPEAFLEAISLPGERVLCFTRFKSQGQFLFWRGGMAGEGVALPPGGKSGVWALGERNGVKSHRVGALPSGMEEEVKEGMWFLNQPVTGQWLANPRTGKVSRRSEEAVTAWRYLVLESDEGGIEAEWLALLASLPLGIVALYTSGGRSVHALCRVEAPTKNDWDALCRRWLKEPLVKLGADKGVFSAVRLTRLPRVWRRGSYDDNGSWQPYRGKDGQPAPRRQELLFLNPGAEALGAPILGMEALRVV